MDTIAAEEYLNDFQAQILHELTPVVVILSIVSFLGIVGNSFTIGFYGFVAKRTPTIFMITVLACVDLLVCILLIPAIAEIFINYNYTSAVACKLMHFFGRSAISTSAWILGFIAIDRYRHVCCPFKRQFSFLVTKRTVVVIIALSLVFSVRDFFIVDIPEYPIDNPLNNDSIVIGHYCGTREDAKYKVIVNVFYYIDGVLVIMILVTFLYTYSRIIWTLKRRILAQSVENKQTDKSEGIANGETKKKDVEESTGEQPTSDKLNTENPENKLDRGFAREFNNEKTKQINNSKTKGTGRSITLMMLVVSVVYILCFVPFLFVKVELISVQSTGRIGPGLVDRLPFVNSFANPLVFCLFNPQFRRYIKDTTMRLKRWCGRSGTAILTTETSQNHTQ